LLLSLVALGGCDSLSPVTNREIGYARERAMAEIAIAAVTSSQSPTPIDGPKVGAKCPECNDPPGACGVGKVGDGRVCVTCRTCGGDGRIDQRDITGDLGPSVLEREVPKEVTLHMTMSTRQGWPSSWYAQQHAAFTEAGWKVRVILEPESHTQAAYFDVTAPDGEVFQFFEPITLESVKHLEQR
jgi:hypothetical protein